MNKLPIMFRTCMRITNILTPKSSFSVRTNSTNTPTDTPPGVSFQDIATALDFQGEEKGSSQTTNSLPLPTSVPNSYMRVLKILQNTNKLYIQVSRHNVIATLTTPIGKPLTWASCGMVGFKNARKRTEFASTTVGRCIGEKTLALKIENVHLKVKGLYLKRRIATVKGIIESGVNIIAITENNRLPFGMGPKPPARRSL